MRAHQIRHLPVLDGRHIFGIISDRDIKLAKAVNSTRRDAPPVFVKDICISEPYVVDENEPLDVVAAAMGRRRLGSAIITKKGEVSGIFTTTDACRMLAELARKYGS
jgi:acetoin utilization protein AcuB